ncbi:vitamin B12-dependent ribonucleotide reductase [archaeon]|jgi:ribonucleoside-diphosphate reductase alpha chain|nr:vitamin B12-dependent ribonucleotide reductase [archaeon]MBT4241531.1 vitamin B12-dependent ribonucleotide reductase [archaeon]MBT4417598.1 vitamin B12-dependent ribonucleotide reductase [archaeon]
MVDLKSKPYNEFEWAKRNLEINTVSGDVIYQAKGVEFPTSWTDQAANVVAQKYFFGGDGETHLENSLGQLVSRVTDTLTGHAVSQGVVSEDESTEFNTTLSRMVLNQEHAFNSPVWFNVGLNEKYGVSEDGEESSHWAVTPEGDFTNKIDAYERPQGSACFIQSIGDNMEGILRHAYKEGMLFKFGSGTGSNYSNIRGANEPLSGGGVASGVMSFMGIYDEIAGGVRSGGKTRRAAKMVILDVNHPDIFRFVYWKANEEKKSLWLSSMPQWGPTDNADLESEAVRTVNGQNGNNSVRVTDEFMEAAINESNWVLNFRKTDDSVEEKEVPLDEYADDRYLPDKRFVSKVTNKKKVVNAGELLEHIARAAAVTGDPALQYDGAINKWHTCPNSGKIVASNPCSEYMFIDDSACNLASINLKKVRDGKTIINAKKLEDLVTHSIKAQETLVDSSSYPSKEIAENSHKFRPLGLGYTNLGALIMEQGVAYDSDEGRAIASAVTSLMTAYAYKTSAELAKKIGAFEGFDQNREPMLKVLEMHKDETHKINVDGVEGLGSILDEAKSVWDEVLELGAEYGFRNAQTTLLAPTGTIGFMMGVDCTGIEPMSALKVQKGLAGGGKLDLNIPDCISGGLEKLGYSGETLERILGHIDETGSVVGAPKLNKEHHKVFATAFGNDGNTIHYKGHLKMMAATQPFLSGAISKTVNLPKGSDIETIKQTYIEGWRLGLKSVSLYVDGAKGIQPITAIQKIESNDGPKWGERIKPGKRGELMRWNVDIGGQGVQIMVGEYTNRPPQDSPADYFVLFGSSGSQYAAAYETMMKNASRLRQSGETLDEFIKHNLGARGSIGGFTNHSHIRSCTSIEDFTAKLIQLEYFGDTSVCMDPDKITPDEIGDLRCNQLAQRRREEHFKSRIEFIDSVMNKGELTEIKPLYQDDVKKGDLPISSDICKKCGSLTEFNGANCKKCPNCGDAEGCG